MNLHEEITRTAYELYEKSGRVGGRDFENWIDAERIVLTRHASQDIEEPEGEEAILAGEEIIEEVEATAPMYARREKEENATVIEELEVQSPALGTKADMAMKAEKTRPAKPPVPKTKKMSPKKTGPHGREKYH